MGDKDIPSNVAIVLQWLIFTVVCQMVNIFGICTKVINIICFTRQDFQDAVTVSLLGIVVNVGLEISDLCCLLTLVWSAICLNPEFNSADLPFESIEFSYLTGGWPHATFNRITSWITALITLERCLAITQPLKVKQVVTPSRVIVIIVCIFVVFMSSGAPVYVVNRIQLKFFPLRNRTILGLVHLDYPQNVEKIAYIINNVLFPFTAFMVIIICTIVLVIQLQNRSKWRRSTSAPSQALNACSRSDRVAKMVVMISVIFIACFTPLSINFIAMTVEPELSLGGKYVNVLLTIMGIGFALEAVNSSVNIFIYYYMSSRYRVVFHQLFHMRHE